MTPVGLCRPGAKHVFQASRSPARAKRPLRGVGGAWLQQDQKPLTLTLSLRERELTARGFKNTADQLPLPLGEGWGEGFI